MQLWLEQEQPEGPAAALLAEAGLSVLVLDAGLLKSSLSSYLEGFAGPLARQFSGPVIEVLPSALVNKARSGLRFIGRSRQPIQTRCSRGSSHLMRLSTTLTVFM
jgi:hypothetical protein